MRLIDADAFERAVMFSDDEDLQDVIYRLRDFPTIEPERKAEWIPCRNHLPSLRDEIYLVSLAWGGVGTMEFKDTGWHNYGSLSPVPIETVIALMPLPEPYAEGRTDAAE